MSTRTTQAQAESPIQRVVDHIVAERFTGVLRVRAREADGELWFLAGIEEDARFGMSKGKEAAERLMRATDPVFEAEQRLPGLAGGFKKALSPTGSFAEVQPVDLMRYCEMFALTCVLDLVGKEQQVRLTYRTGELLSADTASGGDEVLASLLESQEGTYQFELPAFDLPSGVNRPRISLRPGAPPGMVTAPAGAAAAAAKASLAERVDLSLASDGGRGDSVRPESTAQARSKAEAEAEAQRQADARPRYEDERQVDARRRAQEREAEARRRAQEEREAEEARRAVEEREADERRQAEEREADERRAEEERVEAERRRADEEREAEARRAEERRADAKRTSEPKREAQRPREVGKRPSAAATPRGRPTPVPPPRTLQWLWLLLALAAIVVANYFLRKIH